ncbi:MFS transporter [Saccharothrix australiensis]|uniref:EmrB/QacA subfamily drug resistance transporter n=1 Tax=Saccharothrix australiensis TaxID=2072 RepID=A0A495VYB7_9PSEU|nr:MFS transporter [Saccharothrix australiensis]RKT53830.1 EmrB/QacA subfamily drug resistance transporter [Saccharothrix australiensis]
MSDNTDGRTVGGSGRAGALGLLCVAHLLIAMDFTIVFVALPVLGGDLGLTDRELTYVTATYGLTFAAFLLLGGRAADLFGRRGVLLAGLAIFAVASVVAVLGTPAALLVGRGLQGAAAGVLTPAAQALLTTLHPEGPRRNRALSWWGITGAGGLALGGPVGGVLTEAFGWQSVMLINVPVGLGCLLWALRAIRPDRADRARPRRRFHLPSVLIAGAGLGLLVWTVAEAAVAPVADTALRSAAVVVLLAVFVLLERRSTDPVIHTELLRARPVAAADLMSVFFGATLGGQFFAITLYLQQVAGLSALLAGLAFIPVTLFMVVGNTTGAALLGRIGITRTLLLGIGVAAVAELALAFLPTSGGLFTHLVPAMAVLGFGQGVAFVAITVAATASVAEHQQGVASSLLNVGMNVGQSIGPAVLAAIVTWRSAAALDAGAGAVEATNRGLHGAFFAITAIALLGLLVCGLLLRGGARAAQPVGRG